MKKYISLFTVLGLMSVGLLSCENDDTDFSAYINDGTTTDTLSISIVYSDGAATLSGDIDNDAIEISQDGSDITITSTTSNFLELTLSGSTSDGSLLVNSLKKYGIILNGVEITNADGPAINNQCGKSLFITCADGTSNVLTDGTTYAEATIDQKGTLFSEGQIYFLGTGTLTVNANTKNAIASDDYIVINENVTLNVNGNASNGIKVNDGIFISNGNLNINVTADGGRGIKCDSVVTISGGDITINTSGDCLIETVDGVADTTSCAGIKCDYAFSMSDGTLTITSSGDGGKGINSSDSIIVSGGTLTATTTGSNDTGKPKAVKSDVGIYLSGGSFEATCNKSWACDNGSDSDEPSERVTVIGTPTETTYEKRHIIVIF